jgi:hypothetical protein
MESPSTAQPRISSNSHGHGECQSAVGTVCGRVSGGSRPNNRPNSPTPTLCRSFAYRVALARQPKAGRLALCAAARPCCPHTSLRPGSADAPQHTKHVAHWQLHQLLPHCGYCEPLCTFVRAHCAQRYTVHTLKTRLVTRVLSVLRCTHEKLCITGSCTLLCTIINHIGI